MDNLILVDGKLKPLDPSLRGGLLVCDTDAIRRIQSLYSILLRAFVGMTLLSLFVSIPYMEYDLLPLFFSLGSIVLTVNMYRLFTNVMRFDKLMPGVYENGVQLAGNLFLPYAEIAEVHVRKVPFRRSKEVLHIRHRSTSVSWKFPLEIVGRKGVEMISERVRATP